MTVLFFDASFATVSLGVQPGGGREVHGFARARLDEDVDRVAPWLGNQQCRWRLLPAVAESAPGDLVALVARSQESRISVRVMDAGLYVTVVATETDFAFLWKMAEKHLGTVGVTLTMSVAVDAVLQAHSKYNLRVILQSVVKDLCGAVSFAFHPD